MLRVHEENTNKPMQSDGTDVSVKWLRCVFLIRGRSQDLITSVRFLAGSVGKPSSGIVQTLTHEGQRSPLWLKRLIKVSYMLSHSGHVTSVPACSSDLTIKLNISNIQWAPQNRRDLLKLPTC